MIKLKERTDWGERWVRNALAYLDSAGRRPVQHAPASQAMWRRPSAGFSPIPSSSYGVLELAGPTEDIRESWRLEPRRPFLGHAECLF